MPASTSATTPVTLYRTQFCAYCVLAPRLLHKRGIPYREVWLDGRQSERAALQARTHYFTMPQIFVGETFVGGYTDLARIDASGKLTELLAEATA